MRFSDIATYLPAQCVEFEIQVDDPSVFQEGDFVEIFSKEETFLRKLDNPAMSTYGKFLTKQYGYEFEEKSVGIHFCQVIGKQKNILHILMAFDLNINYEDTHNPNGIAIAVLSSDASVDDMNALLSQEYSLSIGGQPFYIIAKHVKLSKKNSFVLVDMTRGRSFSVVEKRFSEIEAEQGSAGDLTYAIDSSERAFVHPENYAFVFCRVPIRFVDKTKKERLNIATKTFIQNGGSEYVNMWKLYAETQMELKQIDSEETGKISFNSCVRKRLGVYKLNVKNEEAVLHFFERAPKENGVIRVQIQQLAPQKKFPTYAYGVLRDNYIPGTDYVECILDDGGYLSPFLPGTVTMDIAGDIMVYKRRMMAFEAIQKQKSANTALPYLLEGRTVNNYSKKDLNDSAKLDETIISKFFRKYPPNPSQRKAIEIAMKTPDVAIIKGPPGTGKTKVIKTIEALLKAQQKNEEVRQDAFLLTAYQRDATKNMTRRDEATEADEFQLPIIAEFGKRGEREIDQELEAWCERTSQHILDRHEDVDRISKKKLYILSLLQLQDAIEKPCSVEQAFSILEQAIEYGEIYLNMVTDFEGDERMQTLEKTLDSLRMEKTVISSRVKRDVSRMLVYYANRIPSSPAAYSDDGEKLLSCIYEKFRMVEHIRSIKTNLEELRTCFAATPVDYRAVKRLKVNLIVEAKKIEKLHAEEKASIIQNMDTLIETLKSLRGGEKYEIISDYLSCLYPGDETALIIRKYQRTLAKTHQLANENGKFRYRDILVDEAARSCPADLMIPLSCVENRIIFVGDDAQLPQYVEEDVMKEIILKDKLENPNELFGKLTPEAREEKYKLSMFEYMTEKAKGLCMLDSKHERVVTLNVQYRMAPVIGDLVSKHFYEGELQNATGFPEDHFKQNYPTIAGKNLVWIDANKGGNREQKSASGSRYRECEVNIIVERIKTITESREWRGKEEPASIGVITFYSAQRDKIMHALEAHLSEDVMKFIEVGTVDAFQGKEFDIVFLSLVRSNNIDRVGFLDSKNRMCVAMSRAKKCLVIVGNSTITKYKNAEKDIPALIDAYKLCEEGGDVCELQSV